MREEVVERVSEVVVGYAGEEEYPLAKVYLVEFLYALKHSGECGKLNSALADRIFNRLIAAVRPNPRDTRYLSVLLRYLNA